MKKMSVEALYRKPNLSKRHDAHLIYPYLLRDLAISRPIRFAGHRHHLLSAGSPLGGHPHAPGLRLSGCRHPLVQLGRILSWQLSNALTTDFCLETVSEAMAHFGKPNIFNTDQGRQFTSSDFTGRPQI